MDVYEEIRNQRNKINAPVDSMGCTVVPETNDDEIRKYQILVSLLFSSQTKDEITHEAINELDKKLGKLTKENVCNANREIVGKCIRKVGFHNRKLENLIKISKMCLEIKMPEELEEVLQLPGIGKKMAYLYLQHGCNKNKGIGVDTHVHRISNRIGLVKTRNPEESRKCLEKVLDIEEWVNINRVMVGFGQVICKPINPRCDECDGRFICPSSKSKRIEE